MDTLARIKKLRKEKGMSQVDIAERLNISQSAYLQIEKGNTELTVSRLEQIADILEVPLYTLMGIEDNKDAKLGVIKDKLGKATLSAKVKRERNTSIDNLINQRIFFWVEAISIIHKMILSKGLEIGCFDYKQHANRLIIDYPSVIYKEAVNDPSNAQFETDVLSAFPKEEMKPVLDVLFQDELFHFLARSIPFDLGLRTEAYERSRKKN